MATIVAITAIELTGDQKKALCEKVEEGAAKAFGIDKKITELMILPPLSEESHGPSVTNQITYFVFTKPDKTDDQKRAISKAINDATLEVTGSLGLGKVIVIIKEHTDNNVGVDGVLKIDM